MIRFKTDHVILVLVLIVLTWAMHQVLFPTKLSQKMLPFQFMHNQVLEPGAFSIAPPAATARSQRMSCHKCGGRKREYTN